VLMERDEVEKKDLKEEAVWTKGGLGFEVEESMEIGNLLPFSVFYDKVVKVL
jgi:hypothetical protein